MTNLTPYFYGMPAIDLCATAEDYKTIRDFCERYGLKCHKTLTGMAIDKPSKYKGHAAKDSYYGPIPRIALRTYIKFNGYIHRNKILENGRPSRNGFCINPRNADNTTMLFTDINAMLTYAFCSILRIKTNR